MACYGDSFTLLCTMIQKNQSEPSCSKCSTVLLLMAVRNVWPRNLFRCLYPHFALHSDDNITTYLFTHYGLVFNEADRLCDLVVRVTGCRPTGPGFDSRCYKVF
jgi:hypothetical protein